LKWDDLDENEWAKEKSEAREASKQRKQLGGKKSKKKMLGSMKKKKPTRSSHPMRTKSENFDDVNFDELEEVEESIPSCKKYLWEMKQKREEVIKWNKETLLKMEPQTSDFMTGNRVFVGANAMVGTITVADLDNDRYEVTLDHEDAQGNTKIYCKEADLNPYHALFIRDATGTIPAEFFEVKKRDENKLFKVGEKSLAVGFSKGPGPS